MVARSVRDAEVVGSNPVASTKLVVRKDYKTQKAQDVVHLVLFLIQYFVFCCPCKIFVFDDCILPVFSKKGV